LIFKVFTQSYAHFPPGYPLKSAKSGVYNRIQNGRINAGKDGQTIRENDG
jgi:hypothetical protein